MSRSSWYASMKAGYTGDASDFLPATTEGMEFGLTIDVSFMGGDATTAPWSLLAGDGGILETCSAVFQMEATFQDVSDTDKTVWYNAGSTSFDVVVPLTAAAAGAGDDALTPAVQVVPAAESGGTFSLMLYVPIALENHISLTKPSSKAGFTRVLASKGLRGVLITPTPTPPGSTAYSGSATLDVGATTLGFNPAVMQQMSATTNCFPGQEDGCGTSSATPASTHAAGNFASTDVNCAAGPWPATQCVKMYTAGAPVRKLLYISIVDTMKYEGGAWVADTSATDATVYTKHAATSGLLIHNSTPCFAHPDCGSAAASPSTFPTWAIVLIAVLGALMVALSVGLYLHHRHLHAQVAGQAAGVVKALHARNHHALPPSTAPVVADYLG